MVKTIPRRYNYLALNAPSYVLISFYSTLDPVGALSTKTARVPRQLPTAMGPWSKA